MKPLKSHGFGDIYMNQNMHFIIQFKKKKTKWGVPG